MENLVKSIDGMITFRASEFLAMETRPRNAFQPQDQLIIWTATWSGGRIFRYPSMDAANVAAKEIQEQL